MSIAVLGTRELQRRLKAISDTPKVALRKIQLDAVANAKRTVPRKTGNLGRSIRPGFFSGSQAIVEAHANYAAYVELGTRPHVIRPKNKKVLAWPAAGSARLSGSTKRGGSSIFAREVHHPGTKPQPYLVPGAKKAIEDNLGADVIIDTWNGAA